MSAPTNDARLVSEPVFRDVIRELLFPLLPGTDFHSTNPVAIPAKNRHKLVTQVGSGTDLKLMPHKDSKVCVQIHRAQVFAKDEKQVIGTFLNSMGRAYRDWNESYGQDTAASAMAEVVAGSVARPSTPLVGRLISTLMSWSQQTYEGNRIAFSVGVDPGAAPSGVDFRKIVDSDFLKVMSSGQDTLVVLEPGGFLVRHETLASPASPNPLMSPIRLEGIADWTRTPAHRVAITLNRNGEILAFRGGELVFARRRGDWRYFAHESVIARFVNRAMASSSSIKLRRELYRTALDAAFARSGACIGVLNASLKKSGVAKLINESDQILHVRRGAKAASVAALIGGIKFQELDRRLRLELVSIDGATVLDHEGRVLAVGAILRIGGGSAGGGGREAASQALATYGLGIKVSNDGYIRARNRDGDVIVEVA